MKTTTTNSNNSNSHNKYDLPCVVDANEWYASGERLSYDPLEKHIVAVDSHRPNQHCLQEVFAKTVVMGAGTATTGTCTSSPASTANRRRCDTQTTVSTTGSASVSSWSGSSTPATSPVHAAAAAAEEPPRHAQRWMTLLPGVPEGSYGFSQLERVLQQLESATATTTAEQPLLPPRLYLDYLGMGGSPAPSSSTLTKAPPQDHANQQYYYYSTLARADLVEALWRYHGMERTVVVSVGDASSLVLLELLQRHKRRLRSGNPFPRIEHIAVWQGAIVAPSQRQLRLGQAAATARQWWKGLQPRLSHDNAKNCNDQKQVTLHHHQPVSTCHTASSASIQENVQQDGDDNDSDEDDDDDDEDSDATPVTRISVQPFPSSSPKSRLIVNKDRDLPLTRSTRKRYIARQLQTVVRRRENSSLLYHHTRLPEEHYQNKWKWHLPKLYKEFAQHQGITVTLLSSGNSYHHKKQWKQAQKYLGDDVARPGFQSKTLAATSSTTKAIPTASLLLLSSRAQLDELAQCLVQLGQQDIPGSCRPRSKSNGAQLEADNNNNNDMDDQDSLDFPHDHWSPPVSVSDPTSQELRALWAWSSGDDNGSDHHSRDGDLLPPPTSSIEFDATNNDCDLMLPFEEDCLM